MFVILAPDKDEKLILHCNKDELSSKLLYLILLAVDVKEREIDECSTPLDDLEARISALECNCDEMNCTTMSEGLYHCIILPLTSISLHQEVT